MAEYKVPQDVEADDKLIGPFSFRQFVYILIAVGGIALAWALSRVLLPLLILPIPIVLLFGALALPLRKDQPMETYLAALISFYMKPRKRLWDPDGSQSLIEITVPKTVEKQLTKSFGEDEAERRLTYLADLVDSHGWSVRGVVQPTNTSVNSDVYFEAQQAEDVLATDTQAAHNLADRLSQASESRHQELMSRMHKPVSPPAAPASAPTAQPISPAPTLDDSDFTYNPYPSMQQSIVQPLEAQGHRHHTTPSATPPSQKPVSPDIINLANNAELSVETIAHEANRIHEREALPEDEVTISLR